MTTHHTTSETHKRLENFTTKDIKDLVQQHGKAIEGDKEFILKEIQNNFFQQFSLLMMTFSK